MQQDHIITRGPPWPVSVLWAPRALADDRALLHLWNIYSLQNTCMCLILTTTLQHGGMKNLSHLHLFPGTSMTNGHTLGGLKQQKCTLSLFLRLEDQNQGVRRATLLPKVLRGDSSRLW